MEDYQERVIKEKEELNEKLTKLEIFIENNSTFDSLDMVDQNLLKAQASHMRCYLKVLNARIVRFK